MRVKADNIGRAKYLTAGKEYEVICEKSAFINTIKDDEGEILYLRIGDPSGVGCAYIDGNEWTIIEDKMMERPLLLQAPEGSCKAIAEAHDWAWEDYQDSMKHGYNHHNALLTAEAGLCGRLIVMYNVLAEKAES